MARPPSVSVIGWLTVAAGALSLFSALGALIVSGAMPPVPEMADTSGIYFPTWLFNHMTAFSVVQIFLAIAALVGGGALLRVRPWGRSMVEALAWFSLLGLIGFGYLWMRTATSMTAHLPTDAGMPNLGPLLLAGGAITLLALAIPNVIVIRVLRSRSVRAAMRGTQARQVSAGA